MKNETCPPMAVGSTAPVGRMMLERDKALTHRQREAMKNAPDAWAELPSGMGCTNATLEALERRGLVETRIEPRMAHKLFAGWQWRKTPNDIG